MSNKIPDSGGRIVAKVLKSHGVQFIFTLCGGHISPILIESEKEGIQIIDTRHEVSTVFAADAVYRLTGRPGVAAVTAGPGVTNTITAIKNAQLAESALLVIGGATATILKGRGSLQDIDQISLIKPHVKWFKSVKKVKDLKSTLYRALSKSQEGVPGPVFVELPIDLLYPEKTVRQSFLDGLKQNSKIQKLTYWYVNRHLNRVFGNEFSSDAIEYEKPHSLNNKQINSKQLNNTKLLLETAKNPVVVIGSQIISNIGDLKKLTKVLKESNLPIFLSGSARGLMGKGSPNQFIYGRKYALKNSDLVILAGVSVDFKIDYGRHIGKKAKFIMVNLSKSELKKNRFIRRRDQTILGNSSEFLLKILSEFKFEDNEKWLNTLRKNENNGIKKIDKFSKLKGEYVNPIEVCYELEKQISDESVIVADGGDFIGTFAKIYQPRRPIRWLDPGQFGTLGSGGGFAIACQLIYPKSQVWIIYGDGSSAYSLAEFDTFARHKLPVIGVIGNDASWQQIAREQIELFETPLGTTLEYTDYHVVAKGYGAKGIVIKNTEELVSGIKQAIKYQKQGYPVLINILINKTDYRKGSISI